MTINAITNQLNEARKQVHPKCVVCSADNAQGLQLDYYVSSPGEITAEFLYEDDLEGYPGMLHGGVIAAILDGATSFGDGS